MRGVLLLLVLVDLIGCAGAVPQNVTIESYNVSFDLGFDEPLNGTYEESIHGETFSGVEFTGYTFRSCRSDIPYTCISDFSFSLVIATSPDKKWDPLTIAEIKRPYKSIDEEKYKLEVYEREIDDEPGFVVVFEPRGLVISGPPKTTKYSGMYQTFNDTVKIDIVSYYPWGNGTLSLLKTFHIERPGVAVL